LEYKRRKREKKKKKTIFVIKNIKII